MKVARNGPFAVGVTRWHSLTPCITVIVKTTCSLDRDGDAVPSPMQLGLAVDYPATSQSDATVEYPSDFAPRKARADVLLVGLAYAARPTRAIPIRFEVDDLSRQLDAVTVRPATAIALTGRHLRARSGGNRVGPRAAPDTASIAHGTAAGFDFRGFNVAPPTQQTDHIAPRARLLLMGLLAGAARREVRIAAPEPQVFLFAPWDHGPRSEKDAPAQEVTMRCDTLWIHTERRLCTLTWRGLVAAPTEAIDGARFIVRHRSSAPSAPREWADLAARAHWEPVVEGHDVPPAPPAEWWLGDEPALSERADEAWRLPSAPEPAGHADIAAASSNGDDEQSQQRTLVMDADTAELELGRLGSKADAAAPVERQQPEPGDDVDKDDLDDSSEKSTLLMDVDMAALKLDRLGQQAPSSPPPSATGASTEERHTGVVEVDKIAQPPTPFRPSDRPPPQTRLPALTARESAERAPSTGTGVIKTAQLGKAPLPFSTASPAPGAAASASVEPAPLSAKPVSQAPRVTELELPLEQYAAIRVALDDSPSDMDAVLQTHGLDERAWRRHERRLSLVLARETREGGDRTARQLQEHEKRAREARGIPASELSLEDYAALRVRVETADAPETVLAEAGLDDAAWHELRSKWNQQYQADRRLAREMRKAFRAARATLRRTDGDS